MKEPEIFKNMSCSEPSMDCDKCEDGVLFNTGEREDSYDQLLDGDFWFQCDECDNRLLGFIEYTATVTF